MNSIKVVHISTVHRASDIRIFQKECRTLAAHGYQVVLIASSQQDGLRDGVRVEPLKQWLNRSYRMTVTCLVALYMAIRQKAQLYHLHDPELLWCGQFLRMLGKRVVFDMHENLPKSLLTKSWLPRLLRPFLAGMLQVAERLLLAGMWVVFAEQSYVKDYPWVRRQAIVLNMPIAEILLRIRAEKHPTPSIVYLGRVTAVRGSTITCEALRVLKEQGLRVRWECVGLVDAVHLEELRSLIEGYGLDEVYMPGYVEPKDAWNIAAKCHVGVALLSPIPNYVESYPTKMFEYMGLGIPVIVSNFPLYKKIVEGTGCGICVDPRSAEEIAEAIKLLVTDSDMARKMGDAGRMAVRDRFNWSNESTKLLAMYDDVFRGRGRPKPHIQ